MNGHLKSLLLVFRANLCYHYFKFNVILVQISSISIKQERFVCGTARLMETTLVQFKPQRAMHRSDIKGIQTKFPSKIRPKKKKRLKNKFYEDDFVVFQLRRVSKFAKEEKIYSMLAGQFNFDSQTAQDRFFMFLHKCFRQSN